MSLNRREFIKKSALGTLGLTILPSLISRGSVNDRVRIAHIGLGGMGNQHMEWFANLPGAEVVALCDVDQNHLTTTLESLKKMNPDTKASTYEDFRKILDRKDIDAITVATPDHWHAQIATLVFQAGRS